MIAKYYKCDRADQHPNEVHIAAATGGECACSCGGVFRERVKPAISGLETLVETLVRRRIALHHAACEYEKAITVQDDVDRSAGGRATERGLRDALNAVAVRVEAARENLDAVMLQCTAADVACVRECAVRLDDTLWHSEKRVGLRA